MPIEQKNILNRLYFVAGGMFIFAIAVAIKLVNIQFVHGSQYRELAQKNTTKNWVIPADRGNVYADDGSLLATSIPEYDIRFDAVTVSSERFAKYIDPLAESLSDMFGKSKSYYINKFKKARANKNRYMLVAKDLGYSDYIKIKGFPLFELGPYKGGLIVEQRTVRMHPIGRIAERMVGNENTTQPGVYEVGLEGAFDSLLRGKEGRRLKQKIAKGQWKPVYDENEVEPQDGFDIISTLNVGIQDIAHHALLKQMEYYEAEHGSVIVMDVKTGEIKAISNLGKTRKGTYYEKMNYAVGESHEPGSTFKTMAFMAALEQGVIDTATVVDAKKGKKRFYGRDIYDSKTGGYGKISAARALEVSSNIGLATLIDENYKDNPEQLLNQFKDWDLHQKLGIPIKGEGVPFIPEPGHAKWSKNALPSISYGYNLRMTPLQVLTFYNAIANDGVMVKPRFIKAIRSYNEELASFSTEVMHEQIASEETLKQMRSILKNVVERGTGKSLYSPYFSMAGKTGTAQTEYWMKGWEDNKRYVSSFAGYFPADNPKYSCIVVIHKPKYSKGYYGADVSGPVFKRIAQKIFTDVPQTAVVNYVNKADSLLEKDYKVYYSKAQKEYSKIPNVVGMEGMDAIALLENEGLIVETQGVGVVVKQSLKEGVKLEKGAKITLKLS